MDEPKRIKRSKDKIIGGVLGGFSDYFNMDPILLRVIYVVLSLFSAGFPGLLLYIILWIAIPEEN